MRRTVDPNLVVGGLLCLGFLVLAALAPLLCPGDPAALGPAGLGLAAPGLDHVLGTDLLGRDVLCRLVHGARVSLLVGWVSVALALVLGTAVGLAAALGPGWLDPVLMRVTDGFLAFPRILLVLLLVSLARPSLVLVIAVLGLTGWMGLARLVRAEALSLRERAFVAAARGFGLPAWRVALVHVLPHLAPTLIVAASLRIGGAMLAEAFLGYLGLGAQDPQVSWGAMIQQGRGVLIEGWWLTAFPGLALTLAVLGYNLLGDGLRAVLDPRGREGGRG
ncbi:MAG TPA: ABC transporter permease [Candidatus Krumholzibacteria bacterium]|nr:ABC transporter permease [Candidatus Krumholzibacteria bacterium]